MALNDKVLLDGILDDRITRKIPSSDKGEAFEFLSFEQILKDYDLSTEEIASGSVDGRGDGGIDGVFTLVNGHLLQDPKSFSWPKSSSEISIKIISCKHIDKFRQATIDALIATVSELFDFGIDDSNLKGKYSSKLLKSRNTIYSSIRKLAPQTPRISVNIYYASRGDAEDLGKEVAARGEHAKHLVEKLFGKGNCNVEFTFIGAREIIELYRKKPDYSLEIPFIESLTQEQTYVILVRLTDYYNFITDNGKLRRYLFDSNVRDFMGLNRVNEDIKNTLEDKNAPDFWWLNNGITILATSARIISKSISASDIQIVNGLQTSESIYRHLSHAPHENEKRCVLVKVIVSEDSTVRDSIIRATNNQTNVELSSLHATDKIQRDIEDIMLRHGLFYERRKNYHVNQGAEQEKIITPLYIAAGYIALVLKHPDKSSVLKSKFMRSDELYEKVFSEKAPVSIWPKIALIAKRTDSILESLRPSVNGSERFLKKWRYIISFIMISIKAKRFDFNQSDILAFDEKSICSNDTRNIMDEIHRMPDADFSSKGLIGRQKIIQCCRLFSNKFQISGIETMENRPAFEVNSHYRKKKETSRANVSDELVEQIKALLPPQPWKPGMHKAICKSTGCHTSEYFTAVDILIQKGIFNRQKDGIVYDPSGNIIAFDPERVKKETITENK